MDVTIADALRASGIRAAQAVVLVESATMLVRADDSGICALVPYHLLKKTWPELLPQELEIFRNADWSPENPKPPLVQLANALTDWNDQGEDEEEEDNEA